jgi:hypothetical protein
LISFIICRCVEVGAKYEKGTFNKKTGQAVSGQVAIIHTKNLKPRTLENYLNRRYYMNVMPKKDNILYKYSLKTKGEFNIINSVPIDPMHTVFHGALNWVIHEVWVTGHLKADKKFSPALMKSLEFKLKNIKGCLPYAIQTQALGTKPLEKFGVTWSCSEKRNFLLYVAIVIMKDPLMDVDAYKLLLSLHHAMLLLVGSRHLSTVPEQYLKKAHEHLLYVVEKAQFIYGIDFPRYVFHCLLHLVEDLRANQCRLDYCSMFKYENSMKFFVHVLDKRSGARVHAQIRNALIRRKLSNIVLPPQ